jgi:hypothetical protein
MAVPHNTDSLLTFEAVISAGLESVHKSTANRFIDMWNATFGLQESVSYPDGVQVALQKLVPFVELQLPSPLASQAESQVCLGKSISHIVKYAGLTCLSGTRDA